MMKLALSLVGLSLLTTVSVNAQSLNDPRILSVAYQDGMVLRIDGCPGFQTMISLEKNEKVENVAVGDSAAWQVTPNRRGDLLFVKPMTKGAFSNMTVVSDKRRYGFELRAASDRDCRAGNVVYEVRFVYPPQPSAEKSPGDKTPTAESLLPPPEERNTAYTYTGVSDLVPLRVFDDGVSTYMTWAQGIAAPAVYAINSEGHESIVNYSSRGDYMVVELVATAFVFRRGEQTATVYNDAYQVQGLDAFSPRPRSNSRRGASK